MPYKSEKLVKLVGTDKDNRVKLTEQDKSNILTLKGTMGRNACARLFKVSNRTIDFIWYPEKLKHNKDLKEERGGWKQYYDRKKHAEYIKKYRKHKDKIYKNTVEILTNPTNDLPFLLDGLLFDRLLIKTLKEEANVSHK